MASALQLSYSLLRSKDPLLKCSMILCHGLFGSKQNWKTMSHALHKKRCGSICSLDLRNHGRSPHSSEMSYIQMASDVIQLANTLSLEDICLVGHSMGGKVAMCAALLKPEKFQKLVVIDSCPVFSHGAHGMMSHLRLMIETDLYRAERESDGSLADIRGYLMDAWKEAVPRHRMVLLYPIDQLQTGTTDTAVSAGASGLVNTQNWLTVLVDL
ncbi:Abhydrolase domain-containing protein 11 [Fasciola gigantica]|uniref:sn-1-specific diacylglycerol lipase ABHD11 n=1 Tax=Fasciola gigantica TaxID=46835 RepID=A0A504Y9J1_FASGI|nr:Abhydrolase domain-containing protein 11 [Fasciola gigantica]